MTDMKKTAKYVIWAVVLLLLPVSQAAGEQAMSLQECVKLALSNNLGMKSGTLRVARARTLQGTAFDLAKTSLSLSQDPTSGGSPDNGLAVSQSFEFPTVYAARKKYLKAETAVAVSSLAVTSNELTRDVSACYYALLHARHTIGILQAQDSVYARFVSLAAAKQAAGEAGNLEVMNARRARSENAIEKEKAEKAYVSAKARQMGLYHQLAQVGIIPGAVAAGKIVSQIPVRAAISGTVGKINVSMGSFVDTSSSLMQIANNAAVYASLNVFERNLAQVRVGQSVDLVVTNSPGLRISGKVFRINRAIDPQTKSVAVHVRIAGGGASGLMAGMYVSGVIQAGQQLVTALPDGAIAEAEGKKYVFVLEGKHKEGNEEKCRFRRAEVTTGASELGYTQVDFVEPVAADATVVTANAFYLASMAADHGEH